MTSPVYEGSYFVKSHDNRFLSCDRNGENAHCDAEHPRNFEVYDMYVIKYASAESVYVGWKSRAHDKRWLCVEPSGRVMCNRHNLGEWETFLMECSSNGKFTFRTHHGGYLCADHHKTVGHPRVAKE